MYQQWDVLEQNLEHFNICDKMINYFIYLTNHLYLVKRQVIIIFDTNELCTSVNSEVTKLVNRTTIIEITS